MEQESLSVFPNGNSLINHDLRADVDDVESVAIIIK